MIKSEIVKLAKVCANATKNSPVAYSFGEEKLSYEDLNGTLRKELRDLARTYALYRENKNTIFSIMEEVIDDVLPRKVMETYGQFAEIKTVGQGEKVVFTNRITAAAKRRAKQFITKVGLAGVYETFRLDGKTVELPITAIGGAAEIGFEEFLDGRIDFADVLEVLLEGMDEAIYTEIQKALVASIANLPAANQVSTNQFVETSMDNLVAIANSYGNATIYCTYRFAATMVPADAKMSDAMKEAKWNNGYLGTYKGVNVVVLPNSFTDENNNVEVIDSKYAWIIPTGAEKPIKIVLEGSTIVREYENRDLSREIQTYKKLGVGTLITNNICVYENKSL